MDIPAQNNPINIDPIDIDKFQMKAEGNTIYFIGVLSTRNPDALLGPFIEKVHNNVTQMNIKEIKVNLTELSFINSAGIRVLANWVIKNRQLPENKKYKIHFISNYQYAWQKNNMQALTLLNKEYTTVKTI
jgi:hypothetical protein